MWIREDVAAKIRERDRICKTISKVVLINSHLYGKLIVMHNSGFIWDFTKESANIHKHGIDFIAASKAFKDPKRKIYNDSKHSTNEERFFCVGKVENRILTVRFTYRGEKIRIIGAGYWRKGVQYYEKEYNGPK